jgi:hypothetical protein
MEYYRAYDLSCMRDTASREYIQHAIDGVNKACADSGDAWLYVEQGLLQEANRRPLADRDIIPRAVFNQMEQDSHSGFSASWTLNALYRISTDYESWKAECDRHNALEDEKKVYWNAWRMEFLVPFYNSRILDMGPILKDYLEQKEQRQDHNEQMDQEIEGLLGTDDEKKLSTLNEIVGRLPDQRIIKLRDQINKRVDTRRRLEELSKKEEQVALDNISKAISSRDIDALQRAVNPAWVSYNVKNSPQYVAAMELLNNII